MIVGLNTRRLIEWLRDDHESRCLSIDISANDPSYPDGGTDADAVWSEHFRVSATEPDTYGDDPTEEHLTWSVHVGCGESMEAAAIRVLELIEGGER